jgi:hypothetical protein
VKEKNGLPLHALRAPWRHQSHQGNPRKPVLLCSAAGTAGPRESVDDVFPASAAGKACQPAVEPTAIILLGGRGHHRLPGAALVAQLSPASRPCAMRSTAGPRPRRDRVRTGRAATPPPPSTQSGR